MADWVTSIEGTSTGHFWAMVLALISAVSHAAFGALQKGKLDPWLTRGVIDFAYLVMAIPLAIIFTPLPQGSQWLLLFGVLIIHLAYKLALAMAYERAPFTVVYPVVRGTGPLVTVAFAGFVFGETYTWQQWGGVFLLSGGIFALGVYNIVKTPLARPVLLGALGFAVLTGILTAGYTTYDAYGIRSLSNPMVFIIWFFVVDGLVFPFIAFARWRAMAVRPAVGPMLLRGFAGGIIAFLSFGCVMMATRLDKVGEAAVLRETSVLFAALIGWLVLKETVGPRRMLMMVCIALGAVIVEFGG